MAARRIVVEVWLLRVKNVAKLWTYLSRLGKIYYCPKDGKRLGGFFTTSPTSAPPGAELLQVSPEESTTLIICAIEYYKRRLWELSRGGRYALEMRKKVAKKLEELTQLLEPRS
ncbi:MAG: hypothetical protein ACK4M3_05715 [Pyrobaculum sp.]